MFGTASLLACGRVPEDVDRARVAPEAREPGTIAALASEDTDAEPDDAVEWGAVEQDPDDPSTLRVHVPTRFEWHEVEALPGSLAAVEIERAVRADGTPYDSSFDTFGTSPSSIRRGFVLEREEWLLGEPLLVEFRVELREELEGSETWIEHHGGNYRARGRDDNFVFVLRRSDGLIVPDIFPDDGSKVRWIGGMIGTEEVTAERPLSLWLPVQHYLAITEPGVYDLYCLGFAGLGRRTAGMRQALADAIPEPYKQTHTLAEDDYGQLVEISTGEPVDLRLLPSVSRTTVLDSPLAPRLPEPVKRATGVTDFAHFRVVIRPPSETERQAMVEAWTAETKAKTMRADAVVDAIWFARQSDFLPLIERWLEKGGGHFGYGSLQDGLALRGTKAARDLLITRGDKVGIAALRLLPDSHVRATIPELIELLGYDDVAIRYEAFQLLVYWTGQHFGAPLDDPDGLWLMLEGPHLQEQFRRWWADHRATFEVPG